MAKSRRARHARLKLLIAVLTVLATTLVVGGVAGLPASAAPTPPAESLKVEMSSNLPGIPQTAGTPNVLVEQGKPFDVTVTVLDGTGAPVVISNKDMAVTLTVAGKRVGSLTVPGNASVGSGTATVAAVGNNLMLRAVASVPNGAKATTPLQGDAPDSFDVMGSVRSVPKADLPSQDVLVSAAGAFVPCEATVKVKTCVDLLLPKGIASDAFFATGVCDSQVGCTTASLDMLLVLAKFGAGHDNNTPATAVLKCDKSLCQGGAIQSYTPKVSLDGDGALRTAPTCAAKGVIQAGEEFCVDYVQSKRDGSGDTYLYVLLARDARVSCC